MRYPKAIWLGNGYTTGSWTGGPFKIVLHTTETVGVPGYNNGRSAPHLTYDTRNRKFYQHTSLTDPARSLRDEEGGIATNRDSVLQLEIVCYSQESVVDKYPNTGRLKVSELTDEHMADIREFLLWACGEFDIQWEYPESDRRMTVAEYDDYNGILGHKHVPENTHWDPGPLDWQRLMEGADVPELIDDRFKPAFVWAIENGVYSGARVDQLDTVKEPMVLQRMIVYLYRYNRKFPPGEGGGLQSGDVVKLTQI